MKFYFRLCGGLTRPDSGADQRTPELCVVNPALYAIHNIRLNEDWRGECRIHNYVLCILFMIGMLMLFLLTCVCLELTLSCPMFS